MICEDCIHFKCSPMVCRGVMDCDPEEWYCDIDWCPVDDEDTECEKYKYNDYEDDYDDYLLEKWECENDR